MGLKKGRDSRGGMREDPFLQSIFDDFNTTVNRAAVDVVVQQFPYTKLQGVH